MTDEHTPAPAKPLSPEAQAVSDAVQRYVEKYDTKRPNNLMAQLDRLVRPVVTKTLLARNCNIKQACADRAGIAKSTFLTWEKLND